MQTCCSVLINHCVASKRVFGGRALPGLLVAKGAVRLPQIKGAGAGEPVRELIDFLSRTESITQTAPRIKQIDTPCEFFVEKPTNLSRQPGLME
jgi:hypothetical protein